MALVTIANKWGVTKTDHIQGYNPSEKSAKTVIKKKACLCAGNTLGRLALGIEYDIFYFKQVDNWLGKHYLQHRHHPFDGAQLKASD